MDPAVEFFISLTMLFLCISVGWIIYRISSKDSGPITRDDVVDGWVFIGVVVGILFWVACVICSQPIRFRDTESGVEFYNHWKEFESDLAWQRKEIIDLQDAIEGKRERLLDIASEKKELEQRLEALSGEEGYEEQYTEAAYRNLLEQEQRKQRELLEQEE